MHPPPGPTALLFAYAFLSNIALAVVPHEPAIIWYGSRLGVWATTLVATAGTMLAAVVDHRVFAPLIRRMAQRRLGSSPLSATRRGGRGVAVPSLPRRHYRAVGSHAAAVFSVQGARIRDRLSGGQVHRRRRGPLPAGLRLARVARRRRARARG